MASSCRSSSMTMMTMMTGAARSRQHVRRLHSPPPPSFGFSGAGFLTCYHLGVAECLLKNGRLLPRGQLPQNESTPMLTGVSGGALATAAILIGIRPEDGMSAMAEIVRRTRSDGSMVGAIMDHLRPGFSLIDQVEDMLLKLTQDVDEELVLRRLAVTTMNNNENDTTRHHGQHRRLLRIGFTDSSYFPHQFYNPNAYVYVDDFDSVDEILAACILSSYIPALTGPALVGKTSEQTNGAVRRATRRLNKMLQRGGSVKDRNGVPIGCLKDPIHGRLWDGGLVNAFPVIDGNTCLVTPFAGKFVNHSISPLTELSSSPSSTIRSREEQPLFHFRRPGQNNSHVQLEVSLQNARALRCCAFSSEYRELELWFEKGHNAAQNYLKQNSLESVYSIPMIVESSNHASTPTTSPTVPI